MSVRPLAMSASSNRVRSFSANTPKDSQHSNLLTVESSLDVKRLNQLANNLEDEPQEDFDNYDTRYNNSIFGFLRSIRCSLFSTILLFVITMAAVIAVLLGLYFYSIGSVADAQHQEKFKILYSLIVSHVNAPKLVTDSASSSLDLNAVYVGDKTSMLRYAWNVFNQSNTNLLPQLWFYQVDDNVGNSAGYYGMSNTRSSYLGFIKGFNITRANYVGLYTIANYRTGALGFNVQTQIFSEPFDLNAVAKTPIPQWGDVYAMNPCTPPCNTFVQYLRPYVNSTGSVSFFSRYVFSTRFLSNTINDIVGNSSVSYIYETKSKNLVACSDLENELYYLDANNKSVPHNIDSYPNDIIMDVRNDVENYIKANPNAMDIVFTRDHDNNQQIAFQRYVDNIAGMDWTFVYVVPVADSIGPYVTIGVIVAVISSVILIGALLAGVIFAWILVKPILHLAGEMSLVENMDLNSIQTGKYHYFSEIVSMQASFYLMIAKLKEYRTYLPSHLLGKVEEEEDDEFKDVTTSPSRKNSALDPKLSRHGSGKGSGKSFIAQRKQSTISNNSSFGVRQSVSSNSGGDFRFMLGLENKDVTVVIMKISNFDHLMNKLEKNDFVFVHGSILKEVMSLMRKFKGDLHDISPSEFILHWNTINKQKSHAKMACSAAAAIKDNIGKLNEQLAKENLPEVSISLGVATGPVTMGNIGNQQKRKFSVFGNTEDLARGIEKLNAVWKTTILMNDKAFNLLNKGFSARPLDEIQVPSRPKALTSVVYELGDEVKKEDDEWMYELKNSDAADIFSPCMKAFSAYQNKDLTSALEQLEAYLGNNPDDMTAQVLKMKWREVKLAKEQGDKVLGVVRSIIQPESVVEEIA